MRQQNKSGIFITGGGTGGHIYPAVAVADALKDEYEIYYVGNPRNLEKEIVQQKEWKPTEDLNMPPSVFFVWKRYNFLPVLAVYLGAKIIKRCK